MSTFTIHRLHALSDARIRELADLLIDSVNGDASVSFLYPLHPERAIEFWRGVAHDVRAGNCALRGAEALAIECGKTLLVLNTATEEAERLYERLGWKRAGVIPGFSLAPRDRTLRDSITYYRELDVREAR